MVNCLPGFRRIQVIVTDEAHEVLDEYMIEHEYRSKDMGLEMLLKEAKQWVIQK